MSTWFVVYKKDGKEISGTKLEMIEDVGGNYLMISEKDGDQMLIKDVIHETLIQKVRMISYGGIIR